MLRLNFIAVFLLIAVFGMHAGAESNDVIDTFNTVIGTQTIDPVYQFTTNSRLVETARAIRDMGANVIKFKLSRDYFGPRGNIAAKNPGIHSLTELVRDEPSHRAVLDMPFANFVLWAYGFSDHDWHHGFSGKNAGAEYKEIYDLTLYLLKTYNGSGKSFYLGHWEGDWWLRGFDSEKVNGPDGKATPDAIQGMIDWLNTRQRAMDDAKRDVPHERVSVWQYTEVNLVKRAMAGAKTVCNDVLPKSRVDFVSYSSYDTQDRPDTLRAALDYIESKLPPKDGIAGKRVFIGEYGFPSIRNSPARQEAKSRAVMRTGMEWGCPFVLYWELYNNETDKDGKQRGFWLIDDQNRKQPVYFTHEYFFAWAKKFAAESKSTARPEEFRKAAVQFLDRIEPESGDVSKRP